MITFLNDSITQEFFFVFNDIDCYKWIIWETINKNV